jgi:heme a synthase
MRTSDAAATVGLGSVGSATSAGPLAAAHPRLLTAARTALVANVLIVVTGGIVRVTGSGLGCAEWPRCEPGSFVPTGEVAGGWHAAIEFGNRLLTFAVLAATLWVLLEVRRRRPLPRRVMVLAWVLPLGVVAQAIIGGVTVLTGLRWWTVSIHFLASMLLIGAAVMLVHRIRTDPAEVPAPRGLRTAVTGVAVVGFVVLVLGTFVTAAGPHGGDVTAPRIGIDIRLLAIAHADSVWLLLGLTVATLLVARQLGVPTLARALAVLLGVSLAQGGLGYLQYWLGIPRELVSLHVVGASLVWLAVARAWVVAHQPGAAGPPASGSSSLPLRVAVIGDSTSFTDATGPQTPDHPTLWPNVLREELATALGRPVDVTVWARPGVDAFGAWQALTQDRHLMFEVVGPAEVVVVAVGSLDHAPAGLPPLLDTIMPRLRPDALRRSVRRGARAAHRWVVVLRRGAATRTPPTVFADRYARVLAQAHGLTMGRALAVALGPTSHRARHHGGVHPRREESEARQLDLARANGYRVVPVWEHVAPHVDRLNPDGVHWPAEAHAAVGRAAAAVIVTGLRAAEPSTDVAQVSLR